MTEDEAKTKWCPFVRYAIAVGASDDVVLENNRSEPHHNTTKCIGSACMAWRATPAEYEDIQVPTTGSFYNNVVIRSEGGFCGLAGKP